MTIGQLLKQYRIENLKTQKEWAGNTISTSYYSKVEKDQHRITAEDLIALLHANNIKLWEFFSKLSQEDKVKHDKSTDIDQAINVAYYRNDQNSLKNIKAVIEESDMIDKDTQLLFVDAMIASVGNQIETLDEKERTKLKEIIFNFSDFDETRIRLYCNFIPFYDLNSNLLISKRILDQFGYTNDVSIQETLLAIIENVLFMCIEQKKFNNTHTLIQAADRISTKPSLFFYKNVMVLLKNIINYHYNERTEYLDKCKIAIDNFTLLGMQEYGHELENFFTKFS